MCNHNTSSTYGNRLEHGKEAHEKHHKAWNRRQFMTSSLLGAAGAFLLNNLPVSALSPTPLNIALNNTETDRILVLINLAGGNDGLNMLVPYTNNQNRRSQYEVLRNGSSRWSTSNLTPLNNFSYDTFSSGDMALPTNEMAAAINFWNNDALAIVPNVGYLNESHSHFEATKIWESGSNKNTSDDRWGVGWTGRYFDDLLPAFLDTPPTCPPALQIGFNGNLVFNNEDGLGMGLTFKDPEEFYRFALSGELYNTSVPDNCPQSLGIAFVRQVANNSVRYAGSVKEAYNLAANDVNYSTAPNKGLGEQLAIVSRLIKGNLGTKVYLVTLDGFDNHGGLMNNHPPLLQEISEAVNAFYEDLKTKGREQQVLTMTYSEFGRTLKSNSNNGTDHGSVAPVLLFGEGVNSGFFSEPVNLNSNAMINQSNTNFGSQLNNGTSTQRPAVADFRTIYATLLKDWLCVDANIVNAVIGEDNNNNIIQAIPNLIANPCTPSHVASASLLGHHYSLNNPNIIEIKYALRKKGTVRLRLIVGQDQILMVEKFQKAGSYTHYFDRSKHPSLPASQYDYILETGGERYKRKVTIYP